MTPRGVAQGFTLAELAMVIILTGLALGGIAVPLSVQVESVRATQARESIDAIALSLLGYAQLHGHLPCPADPTRAETAVGAGQARPLSGIDCEGGFWGALPWSTLGVPQLDPWGRRYSYRVAREVANALDECVGTVNRAHSICVSAPPSRSHHATQDALEVRERRSAGRYPAGTDPIATRVVAVIVSHGANGFGAYLPSGRPIPTPAALANGDEQRNNRSNTVSFITRLRAAPLSSCNDDDAGQPACGFDDVVGWVSRGGLIAHLARADRLR